MGSKLYVGNLSYSVTSSDLQTMFEKHGTVSSAEVINDRESGRSKGFGFVQMGSDDEAQAAISALSGQESDGRALTVNEAKPREDRPRSGGGGGGGGYGGGGSRGGSGGYGGGGNSGGRSGVRATSLVTRATAARAVTATAVATKPARRMTSDNGNERGRTSVRPFFDTLRSTGLAGTR